MAYRLVERRESSFRAGSMGISRPNQTVLHLLILRKRLDFHIWDHHKWSTLLRFEKKTKVINFILTVQLIASRLPFLERLWNTRILLHTVSEKLSILQIGGQEGQRMNKSAHILYGLVPAFLNFQYLLVKFHQETVM